MQSQLRGTPRQVVWAEKIRQELRHKFPDLRLDFQMAPMFIAIRDMNRAQIQTFLKSHSPIEYSPFSSQYPRFTREDALATLAELGDVYVVDTETTGVTKTSEIIDLAVIDGNTGKAVLTTLLRPRDIAAFEASKAAAINRITANDLRDAPTFLEMHERITELLEERPLVAYNCDFDSKMLERTYYRYGIQCPRTTGICLMKLLSGYLNISDYLSLDEAIKVFELRSVRGLDRHSALFDGFMAYRLLTALRKLES